MMIHLTHSLEVYGEQKKVMIWNFYINFNLIYIIFLIYF